MRHHSTESVGDAIRPDEPPSGNECLECEATGQWWLHLRRCAQCGHVGCCDSSPNQHAREHFNATNHPIIASFEPCESWFYNFESKLFLEGPELAAPRWHPAGQPVPGPAQRVPKNWQSLLRAS